MQHIQWITKPTLKHKVAPPQEEEDWTPIEPLKLNNVFVNDNFKWSGIERNASSAKISPFPTLPTQI